MAQVYAIGKVTADLKLMQSSRKEPYACFDITENIGGWDSRRKQTWQIFAFYSDAEQLICDGVREGILIWSTGNLELEEFTPVTNDKSLSEELRLGIRSTRKVVSEAVQTNIGDGEGTIPKRILC